MATYIEREAAKKEFTLNFGGVSHAVIANRLLDAIPAADVVAVVRCRECKHCEAWKNRYSGFEGLNCNLLCADISPDDFCSYGERREEDG